VLDALTVDAFASAVGEVFVLEDEHAGRLELELLEARAIDPGAPATDAGATRAPFSILFRGPAEPMLPQRIYRLQHEAIGTLEIFIVPVARDADGVRYEAIFA
jgi:hypothetical protein